MAMCRPRRIDSMVNGPWSPASGTGSVGAGGGGRLSGGAMAECGAGHRRRRAADGGRHSLRGDVLRGSVGDRSRVVVEAAFGLGEVVSGAVDAVAATQAVGVSSGAPGTRRTAKAGQMAREVNAREAATV